VSFPTQISQVMKMSTQRRRHAARPYCSNRSRRESIRLLLPQNQDCGMIRVVARLHFDVLTDVAILYQVVEPDRDRRLLSVSLAPN
jgi:hypothetical protein